MRIQRFQRSIRFLNDEWNVVIEAAERNDITLAVFAHKASARAAARNATLMTVV